MILVVVMLFLLPFLAVKLVVKVVVVVMEYRVVQTHKFNITIVEYSAVVHS